MGQGKNDLYYVISNNWLTQFTYPSMANPHVSGIAAMLMSKRVFQSPHELYGILRAMATPNTLKPQDKAGGALLAYNGPNAL